MEFVLSAFIATLVTLPIVGYLIIFVVTKRWTKNHRKAVQYGINSSVLLLIVSVHFLIQSIFNMSLLWLVISVALLLSIAVVLVHLRFKEEIQYAKLLRGMIAHVNLIPINKIEDGKYTKSSNENIIRFRDYLNDHGIVATIRRELGSDISAACGQLRKQNLN